ncbi:MAG: glycosyl transferase [Flavobacteriales bacterium]|nr:MAG: glycosyl transferase [Flavobacteriales bacterium]
MNILVDAHIFDDKYQGTRTYIKGLYSALIPIAKDWNFFFIASDVEQLEKEFGTTSNVNYLSYKSTNKFYRLLFDLPKIIKENNIDYAHYQYISPPFGKCKNIVTIHDILFKENRFKKFFPLKYRMLNGLLFKISAKKADVLLTVSNYSKEKINEHYNIPLKEIFVTPNAVPADFKCSNNNIKEKYSLSKYILYVSRIEPRKNHLALLKAYRKMKLWEQGYQLVFIGIEDIVSVELDGYKEKYKLELGKNVLWLNEVDYEDLKCFYHDCELFVFPSFAEGFGIPPLEAIVMDKKVLCSNATAMKDFNFKEDMTFNPSDVEELKNKIKKALYDDNFHKIASKEGVLLKYNWDTIADNFYKLINSKKRSVENE